uniref:Uncharacterized protein n=1 Tax=Periophthalmus magnuspinnatus TaxID=409849 RepID=A0A3B4AR51_9GOBI
MLFLIVYFCFYHQTELLDFAQLFRCAADYWMTFFVFGLVRPQRPLHPCLLRPGPGRYGLPPTIGFIGHDFTKPTSPAYSFHGPAVDLAKTPGPCGYNSTDPNVYLPRQPAFSILGRHTLPKDHTRKPGPGTYNPEAVTVHMARAPAHSLGMRHSEFITPLIIHLPD